MNQDEGYSSAFWWMLLLGVIGLLGIGIVMGGQ